MIRLATSVFLYVPLLLLTNHRLIHFLSRCTKEGMEQSEVILGAFAFKIYIETVTISFVVYNAIGDTGIYWRKRLRIVVKNAQRCNKS